MPAAPLGAISRVRTLARLSISIGVLAACLMLAGCGTTVPDVKGLTLRQANDRLSTAGFGVGRVTYDESLTVMSGVVWQDPAANERWDQGTAVRLIIAGRSPVAVPAIIGLEQDRAVAALAATGLTVGSIGETHSATVSQGEVVTQTPAGGAETVRGGAVDIVVSLGPPPVSVPSVVGLSEPTAKTRLRSAGFSVSVRRAHSSVKKGRVAAQAPRGGTAAPGSTVRLTISTGPKPAPTTRPAPKAYRGVLAVWNVNSKGEFDPKTGYAYIDIVSLGGVRVKARCPYSSLGEGASVWVARQASGAWVVTGRR